MWYTLMPSCNSDVLAVPNPAFNGALGIQAWYDRPTAQWVCDAPTGALIGTDRSFGSELLHVGGRGPRVIIDAAAFLRATTEFVDHEPQWDVLTSALGKYVDVEPGYPQHHRGTLATGAREIMRDIAGPVLGDGVVHILGATLFYAHWGVYNCAGWHVRTSCGVSCVRHTADFLDAVRADGWQIGDEAMKRLEAIPPCSPRGCD